jgi:hypothetical protein
MFEVVILVGFVSTIAAALACIWAHRRAEDRAWGFLWRYGFGALTWLLAIAPSFIAAVVTGLTPIPVAGILYGMIVLVIAGMGVATLGCYQPPITLHPEDEVEAKISKARSR